MTTLSLGTASISQAATEVGNSCIGDRAEPPASTLVQLSSTSNPGSVTVPVSGVITKWGINVVAYPGGISEKLKVLRPAGKNTFTTIGESSVQPIAGGQNSFETRIPVQAGDRLGAFSLLETIFCEEASSLTDVMGTAASDPPVGSTTLFTEQAKGQVAIHATVEPDADGDGYGDETQDKCPQSAAFHTECPIVAIGVGPVVKNKNSAILTLTTDNEAPIKVTGTVKLGKGKTAKLSGGKQVVKPGKISSFTLKFTSKLRAALADLTPSQSLPLKITASAKDVVGRITKAQLKVKLKGQG
jgi:LEA14-like dessication related protein